MIEDTLIVDFHAHILPGADHGSSGIAESTEQLNLLKKYGVDTVVATPHFYPNILNVKDFIEFRDICAEKIKNKELITRPEVCMGAEVLICEGMDAMPDIGLLCIRGTRCILIEMPFSEWSAEIVKAVLNIKRKGFDVILAHIDRYVKNQENELAYIIEEGVKVQINAEALVSSGMRKRLMPYINEGSVWALGSDLHGCKEKDMKTFASGYKLLGDNCKPIMAKAEELLSEAERL